MADTTAEEASAGFRRQRRGVMLVSLALLAFQATGATLSKLVLFGNDLELRAPLNVAGPLWVGWAYFLIRMYQYLYPLGDLRIAQAYRDCVRRLVEREAVKELKARLIVEHQAQAAKKKTFDIQRTEVRSKSPGGFHVAIQAAAAFDDLPGGGGRATVLSEHNVTVRAHSLVRSLRSAWWVAARTHLITEYVLPFAVASAPVAAALPSWVRAIRGA